MKTTTRWLIAALILSLPLSAHAHRQWILPSSTVLAQGQWVTVDAAVSNDLFFFNYVPMRLDNLQITAPDGSAVAASNPHTGKYRSVFDVELTQTGTYRLAVVNQGLMAMWQEDGEGRRWRGSPEAFASEVPADAEQLRVIQTSGRVETFVTAGAPNATALAATNSGLELVPDTHPNDLFAGESVRWRFLIDGEPAAGLDIEVVPGGIRYRDAQDDISLSSDAEGYVELVFPEAGMYGLEASISDENTRFPQASQRRASYSASFEVLPQ